MENMRMLRSKKGISQQRLADALGLNQQSVHRYETGENQPDIQTLVMFADYFETSIDYLVGRTDIDRKIEPVERYELNREEAHLVDTFRSVGTAYKRFIATMLEALAVLAKSKK